MGFDNRKPTDDELEQMEVLVKEDIYVAEKVGVTLCIFNYKYQGKVN